MDPFMLRARSETQIYCTVFEEVLGSLGKYSCMQAIYTSLQALVQADDNLKVVSRA